MRQPPVCATGAATVVLDVRREPFAAGPSARPDVAGADLVLDEHVRVHRDVDQVVGGVALGDAVAAPVIGQPHLLDELIVSVTPVLLGAGAPLLPRRRTEPMRLLSATPSPAGTFVHLHYTLR